jgi:hypothetical protein
MLGHEAVIGLSHLKVSRIAQIGTVCNNAEVTRDSTMHGSPTVCALVVLAHKTRLHAVCARYTRLHENAFTNFLILDIISLIHLPCVSPGYYLHQFLFVFV